VFRVSIASGAALTAIQGDMTKTQQHPLEKILESRIAIID
jgi:hypothetical protein